MKFKLKFDTGKEYRVLDAESSVELLTGNEVKSIEYWESHSRVVSFDKIKALIIRINDDFMQYYVAENQIKQLKAMTVFSDFLPTDIPTRAVGYTIFHDLQEIMETVKRVRDGENLKEIYLYSDGQEGDGPVVEVNEIEDYGVDSCIGTAVEYNGRTTRCNEYLMNTNDYQDFLAYLTIESDIPYLFESTFREVVASW